MPPFEPDRSEARERRDLVLPLLFVSLAGLSLILPPPAQQQVSLALRSTVLSPFIRAQEGVLRARAQAEEASDLQIRLDSATARLISQSTLLEENLILRDLLDLRRRAGTGFVAASAIRAGTLGSESMFLLDVGSEQGVAMNDPVVVADGLIGVVREASTGTSVVMDWTHPEFGVSVMTFDGTAFGFVEVVQGAFREEDRLILNGVPFYTPVEEGAPLVTSGRGSVYPRGIPVGTVESLAEAEAGWRKSFWVEPAARPGSATHVLVLVASPGGVDEPLEHLWYPDPDLPGPEGGTDTAPSGESEAGTTP